MLLLMFIVHALLTVGLGRCVWILPQMTQDYSAEGYPTDNDVLVCWVVMWIAAAYMFVQTASNGVDIVAALAAAGGAS